MAAQAIFEDAPRDTTRISACPQGMLPKRTPQKVSPAQASHSRESPMHGSGESRNCVISYGSNRYARSSNRIAIGVQGTITESLSKANCGGECEAEFGNNIMTVSGMQCVVHIPERAVICTDAFYVTQNLACKQCRSRIRH